MAGKGFLAGLQVIDIGHSIAGPFCGRLMAFMGADVLKVEPPEGDQSRRAGPFPEDLPESERSGLFHYLNAGKRGVTLNLKSERGRDLFLSLVEKADVVIENFEPRVMPSLALDYETLRDGNPRLVLTSISNFGQTGPYRDYKSDEIGIQAVSGLMHMAGEPDRPPLKKGGNYAQYLGGTNAFSATLAALYEREDTGAGQHVDISLAETFASIHGRGVKVYSYTGTMLKRLGTNSRPFPSGAYPCADGYVVLQGPMGRDWWPAFVDMVGNEELKSERFRDSQVRRSLADEMEAYLLPWLAVRTREEVMKLAQEAGIAAGVVALAPDMLSSPQLQHRHFFYESRFDTGEPVVLPGLPYRFTGIEMPAPAPAPRLGQDNVSVFEDELDISSVELLMLAADGVI